KTTSPDDTARHTTRLAIEPSSTALRSCGGVRTFFNPSATLASGVALRMNQASDFPRGSPIVCANASSGWTWMDRGWLVNSSLSNNEGSGAALSDRPYQISPIASPSLRTLLQG